MRALYQRHSRLNSKLVSYKDICITIQGVPVIIEYSNHSLDQSKYRGIFESAATHMVKQAFEEIIDLHSSETFILVSHELGISLVASIRGIGGDVLVSIITAIDSAQPTNPYHTHTIAV